jgi:hypothetical protein
LIDTKSQFNYLRLKVSGKDFWEKNYSSSTQFEDGDEF